MRGRPRRRHRLLHELPHAHKPLPQSDLSILRRRCVLCLWDAVNHLCEGSRGACARECLHNTPTRDLTLHRWPHPRPAALHGQSKSSRRSTQRNGESTGLTHQRRPRSRATPEPAWGLRAHRHVRAHPQLPAASAGQGRTGDQGDEELSAQHPRYSYRRIRIFVRRRGLES